MISVQKLMGYFDVSKTYYYSAKDPSAEAGGIVTLVNERQLQLENEIFFAVYSTFEDISFDLADFPDECIFFYGCPDEASLLRRPGLLDYLKRLKNCYIYTDLDVFNEVYYSLAEVYSIHARMHSLLTKISQLAVQDSSVQEIVDNIALTCNCAVAINDNAMNLISYSLTKTRQTELGVEEMSAHALSEDTISGLSHSGILNRLYTTTSPIKFTLLGESAYVTAIRLHGLQFASMTAFEGERPINPMIVEYFPDIANVLSHVLSDKGLPSINKFNNIPYLLSFLLDPGQSGTPSFRNMQNRFGMFGYNLFSNMNLLYIDSARSAIPSSRLKPIAEMFHSVFKNSCFMLADEGVIYLISRTLDQMITENEISSWSRQLKTAGLVAGLSEHFSDFNDFDIRLEEAKAACREGVSFFPDQNLFLYEKLRMKHIAKTLLATESGYRIYLYPPLMKLLNYDQQNGTDLQNTLRVYARSPHSLDTVSQQLFIHKNTLLYRLNKIRSIMGTDLKSGEEFAQILISFEMIDVKGTGK